MHAPEERRLFIKSLFYGIAFGCASFSGLKKGLNNSPGRPDRSLSGRAEAMEIMRDGDHVRIDAFTHVAPKKYVDLLQKALPDTLINQPLWDLDQRFRMMDQIGRVAQILTLASPPVEGIPDPAKSVDLAKIANDEMAELVGRYPDRFAGAAAALPMGDMDAALREADRSIHDLGLKGAQIYTSVNGKPLDSPEFMPLYEKMAGYDLPIWIHPISHENHPFYPSDQGSKNDFDNTIGWPHATSMAMMRLAASGIMERFPNLKFITHHSGGTIPYLAKRIEMAPSGFNTLKKPIIESLRLFYYDTAVQGNTPNLMCARALCGADHQLFGTDFPMADAAMVDRVIGSINEMDITDRERQMIFGGNLKRILRIG